MKPQTLPAMLNDHTIPTVFRVKGGLSAIRRQASYDQFSKTCALFNFWSEVDFYRKQIIGDRQSPCKTDNIL
jgi:hypothetical protein